MKIVVDRKKRGINPTTDILSMGSFQAAFMAHADTYGLKSPEVLFPEAQVTGEIKTIDRDQTWVTQLLNGIRKLPSKIGRASCRERV